MKNLKKQDGFALVSTELIFILTCCLCVLVACCGAFGAKVIGEWADLGSAIGALNQSYVLTGVAVGHPNDPTHPTDIASWSGSAFADTQDFCDQSATCGVRVCQAPAPELPGGGGPGIPPP